MSLVLVAICITCLAFICHSSSSRLSKPTQDLPLPPGPKGLPLIGNVASLPREHLWRYWEELGRDYGPISCIKIFSQPFIVVSSAKVAHELLNVKSTSTSSRPGDTYTREVASIPDKLHLGLEPYNETFKERRKILHQHFNATASLAYHDIEVEEARRLAKELPGNTERMIEHADRFAAAITLRVLYDMESPALGSKEVAKVADIAHQITTTLKPGYSIISLVSFFKFLPEWIVPSKRAGRERIQASEELEAYWLQFVENKMKTTPSTRSFVADCLRSDVARRDVIAALAEHVALAGSDTIAATLMAMFIAMIRYPEWVKKAQREVDTVLVGALPHCEDESRLPWTWAFVQEVKRYRPVARMAVPHVVTKTEIIDGYLIPEGSAVVPNIWSINQDETLYKDAKTFNPARWLHDDNSKVDYPHTNGRGQNGFGYGRRLCPGLNMANSALFIAFATLIWAYDVTPATDSDGRAIMPSEDAITDEGLVFRPVPFIFNLSARPGVDLTQLDGS